ncbi:APC family permease [soil metagenome]
MSIGIKGKFPHYGNFSTKASSWLLKDPNVKVHTEGQGLHHDTHPWWQVMCLTGVDYFSTLGYQPGIAALAAGTLAPFATLVLVLLTLFGALPIYKRVARESPRGEGSVAMLEKLLPWWQGKLFVLCLIGFLATDFIITITLSAADATAHLKENPFTATYVEHHIILVTLILIAGLAAIFLKGFREAMGIAVVLVSVYLVLNAIVITVSVVQVVLHPHVLSDWKTALFAAHGNPLLMLGVSLLLFPKLALGLSGFETGVAVMPQVRGYTNDTEENPAGRIQKTHKLLSTAALIMSVYLLTSSVVTTLLIPAEAFEPGHEANGRALAYLAHEYLGEWFGTAYDISTISILWFAGASAMAGLLNIIPRYLPRYGMAPNWATAIRPLVFIFTAIAFAVTSIFRADVDAQGGAYATGVLVLMTSASFAVTLVCKKRGSRVFTMVFSLITVLFVYTTGVNIYERPEGIKIAGIFIGTIILTSFLYRIKRSTEARIGKINIDEGTMQLLDAIRNGTLKACWIAKKPNGNTSDCFRSKEAQIRSKHRLPDDGTIVFLEVRKTDSSEFMHDLNVHRVDIDSYTVIHATHGSVSHGIIGFLYFVRDYTHRIPHINMDWTPGNPFDKAAKFIFSGEGDTAPLCRHLIDLKENVEGGTKEEKEARKPLVHTV